MPNLGMPRKASPLSSSKLSVYLTRSYIFIRHMICVLLGAYFQFYLLFEWNHWIWNIEWKRILPWLVNYLTTQCSSLASFWSSLSITHVLHVYPMSKRLNELNVINLNLYMFHMLTTWGVITSHIISIGSKLIES